MKEVHVIGETDIEYVGDQTGESTFYPLVRVEASGKQEKTNY